VARSRARLSAISSETDFPWLIRAIITVSTTAISEDQKSVIDLLDALTGLC
jgi:hypothetical protein